MNTSLESTKKVWIPEISDEKLAELAGRIKPVYRFARKGLCYIKPVDLRGTAFTWDPKPAEKATGLVPLRDITTYHTYGYYGFFKPSIAEVIAKIPEDLLDKAVAFEIVDRPETSEDLNDNLGALNAGYHVATTRIYGKK